MGRFDTRDVESHSSRSPAEPREGEPARRAYEPRVLPLPDRIQPRTRDNDQSLREHQLTLPSGQRREAIQDGRLYHLRGSEVDLLERAARYRAVFTDDLERDSGDASRFRADLHSLRHQDLIDERTVTRLRDGKVADVVSVTGAGKALLDHHRDPEHDSGQEYYAGWVKPA